MISCFSTIIKVCLQLPNDNFFWLLLQMIFDAALNKFYSAHINKKNRQRFVPLTHLSNIIYKYSPCECAFFDRFFVLFASLSGRFHQFDNQTHKVFHCHLQNRSKNTKYTNVYLIQINRKTNGDILSRKNYKLFMK